MITDDFSVDYKLANSATTAASLAENVHRAPMNPVDEFESFQTMMSVDELTEKEIATLFSVSVKHVKQCLKLASIHPKIREAGRAGQLTIDCLSAFTVSDNQDKQWSVWSAIKNNGHHSAYAIRRQLMEGAVASTARLAKFVGVAAYKKAGGIVSSDLFEDRHYLEDRDLLETLAQEKLTRATAKQAGWKWIEISLDANPDLLQKCGYRERIDGPATRKLRQQHTSLEQECQSLEAIDDPTDQQIHRMEIIEDKLSQLEDTIEQSLMISAKDKIVSGCLLSVDHNGQLSLHEGLITPDEIKKQHPQSSSETDKLSKPTFSQSLGRDLNVHKVAISKHYLSQQYTVAFDLMLCQLVTTHARQYHFAQALSANFNNTFSDSSRGDVSDSTANSLLNKTVAKVIQGLSDATEPVAFYQAIKKLPQTRKETLFAVLTSLSLSNTQDNALWLELEKDLGVNSQKYWQPTADNLFSRVNTQQLITWGKELFGNHWTADYEKLNKKELVELLHKLFSQNNEHQEKSNKKLDNWLPECWLTR